MNLTGMDDVSTSAVRRKYNYSSVHLSGMGSYALTHFPVEIMQNALKIYNIHGHPNFCITVELMKPVCCLGNHPPLHFKKQGDNCHSNHPVGTMY